jgi:hypothetical protein
VNQNAATAPMWKSTTKTAVTQFMVVNEYSTRALVLDGFCCGTDEAPSCGSDHSRYQEEGDSFVTLL